MAMIVDKARRDDLATGIDTWSAAPDSLPISAILPFFTATSPWNAGMPEPSITLPFLMRTSYAIGFLLVFNAVQPAVVGKI
jgi:hypothetical protein